MCDLADDICDIWDQTWPRARKPHVCMACREVVSPGQRYHRLATLYEGNWDHWKHCRRCWRIFEAISAASHAASDDPVAIDPGLDCGESWQENFGELPPEVTALAFVLPGEAV